MDGRRAPPLSPLAKLVSAGLTWALLGIGISLQQQAKWRPSNILGYASSLLYLSDTGGARPDVCSADFATWVAGGFVHGSWIGGGFSIRMEEAPPARNVGGFKGCTYNYFEF